MKNTHKISALAACTAVGALSAHGAQGISTRNLVNLIPASAVYSNDVFLGIVDYTPTGITLGKTYWAVIPNVTHFGYYDSYGVLPSPGGFIVETASGPGDAIIFVASEGASMIGKPVQEQLYLTNDIVGNASTGASVVTAQNVTATNGAFGTLGASVVTAQNVTATNGVFGTLGASVVTAIQFNGSGAGLTGIGQLIETNNTLSFPPPNTAVPTIGVNTTTGILYYWNTNSQTWQ